MRHLLLSGALIAVLSGCSSTMSDADSRNVQQHTHQVLPESQLRTLRVENVQGAIVVTGTKGGPVTLDYTKYAGHQESIDNTQVVVDHTGSEIDAHTNYVRTGWFGSRGAGVDYTIAIPAGTSVHLANVSGPVTIRNVDGNIEIQEVSGQITAALGRVAGDRDVRVNTVSGGTVLTIAPDSDVTIGVKNVSGSVRGFFPMNTEKGFVGQSVRARLGSGTATIDVNAVSGSVDINRG